MPTPDTSLAVFSNSPRESTRAGLFVKLAKLEDERSNVLRLLGLQDSKVAAEGGAMIDQGLLESIDALTERVVKMESKLFAEGLVRTNAHNARAVQPNETSEAPASAKNGASSSVHSTDAEQLAEKAREFGCPVDWLIIGESARGLRFVKFRHGKAEEYKKLSKKSDKERTKAQAETPDGIASASLKMKDVAFMAWCRGDGKELIVNKKSGISKEVRQELQARILSIQAKK